jgi:hypothetical protein
MMNPGPTQRAVDDLTALSETVLADWKQRASKVAGQMDSGNLAADQAAQNFGECMNFGLRSFALACNVAMDIAATLAGSTGPVPPTTSTLFETPASAALAGTRTLSLRDALKADVGTDSIPKLRVTFVPKELQTGESEFRFVVDATGYAAVGYSGVVDVTDAAGTVLESVDVFLMAM